MKILLTGANSGIGSAIKESLKDHDVVCVNHPEIDTSDEFDWLICAHGIINEQSAIETFLANVISNIKLTQKVKSKNIIFISSTAGINGNSGYPIYAASKGALITYCKSISNCYALCPGPTDTLGWRKLKITDRVPQHPDEVAKAVEKIMAGEFKSGDIITVRDGIIS